MGKQKQDLGVSVSDSQVLRAGDVCLSFLKEMSLLVTIMNWMEGNVLESLCARMRLQT